MTTHKFVTVPMIVCFILGIVVLTTVKVMGMIGMVILVAIAFLGIVMWGEHFASTLITDAIACSAEQISKDIQPHLNNLYFVCADKEATKAEVTIINQFLQECINESSKRKQQP